MDLFERALEETGGAHLGCGGVGKLDFVPTGIHLGLQGGDGANLPLKHRRDTAVLYCLVGITAGNHRNAQPPCQGVGQLLCTRPVQCQILSVEIQKTEMAQLLLRQLRHMARSTVGVAAPHQHGIFLKQAYQLGKGKKLPLLLMGFQPVIELQNGLQRANGQDVASLGHIGLHTWEHPQAIFQLQYILRPAAHRGEVAVELFELQGVEMLRQAQGVQSGPAGLTEEPIGIGGGEGQLFGQLSVGVKIKSQGKNLLSEQCGEENRQRHPQGGYGQKQQVVIGYLQSGEFDFLYCLVDCRVPVAPQLQSLHRGAGALGRIEH